MKKYFSLAFGLIMLVGNGVLGECISPDYGNYIALGCIVAGVAFITYSIYCLSADYLKNKNETVEGLIKVIQKDNSIQDEQLKEIHVACHNIIDVQREATQRNQENLGKIENICQDIVRVQESSASLYSEKLDDIISASGKLLDAEKNAETSYLKQMMMIEEDCKALHLSQEQTNSLAESHFKEISQLFQCVLQVCDEMESANKKALEEEERILNQMSKNIQEENRKIGAKVTKTMEDFEEVFEEYDQKSEENLSKLATEYERFQEVTESIIKQLTLMSEQDYEVLKGILND